ncbi:hypothetical protein C100_06880 [Sphingobium sp. C100]|uniref:hypothetical protein n=1 Tax=Sphingobium sp. C100 TaxID=1207055 RepID=UPI0003D68A72|nr:hypothetical protein [Sphingobium sp. C100]ETI64577.1 hypothetical protein C100_06880 [Sphingobium sp. C100]
MSDEALTDAEKTRFTLALVEQCVRNTFLEELHAGTVPDSAVGDYSDVKVVTPFGEIPWTQLSRISDAEMKTLMIEITNKVFTFLTYAEDLAALGGAVRWNRPEIDMGLERKALRRRALRLGTPDSPEGTD